MKLAATLSRYALGALAAFGLANLPAVLAAPPPKILPPVSVGTGGVQMSLSTSTYRIVAGDYNTGDLVNRKRDTLVLPARESLIASAMLANRSGNDITFAFPDAGSAAQHFRFRVFDSANQQVWDSGDDAITTNDSDVISTVAAVLRARSKWSATVRVPLKKDGIWLPVGIYTLEASVAGTPSIGATAVFEIAAAPVIDPPPTPANTGIKGTVTSGPGGYQTLEGGILSPAVIPMPIKANIVIEEIVPANVRLSRPLFTWRGESGMDGTFKVATPVGHFRVQASTGNGAGDVITIHFGDGSPDIGGGIVLNGSVQGDVFTEPAAVDVVSDPFVAWPTIPPVTSAATEATVTKGAYSTVDFQLGGGIRYEQPHNDTGITGHILRPSVTGDATPVAASGAKITVEQTSISPIFPHPPFRWTGVADQNGNFQVNTPPGTFRITAVIPGRVGPIYYTDAAVDLRIPVDPLPISLRGTAEATVTNAHFSDVTITLAPSGIIVESAPLIYSVSSVEVKHLETFVAPAQFQVSAKGTVTTTGWTNPTLRVRRVTADGILELDFVATRPTGVSLQVLTPISAETHILIPPNFNGVRVFSSTNFAEALAF